MTDSIAFDRAAEIYDRTRAIPDDVLERTLDALAAELEPRGRCLEIGVGTGILALRLHERGVPMAGVDLSAPMVGKLLDKAGGELPFPLALGDATRMPFRRGAFGSALARWVFHLIPDWRQVVDELARVVRPGGAVLVHLGDLARTWEIVDRFLRAAGEVPFAVGLDPRDPTALDEAFGRWGARLQTLPPIASRDETTVGEFLDEMLAGQHSWTWRVPAEVRAVVLPEVGRWAVQRFGSAEEVLEPELRHVWRVYELP